MAKGRVVPSRRAKELKTDMGKLTCGDAHRDLRCAHEVNYAMCVRCEACVEWAAANIELRKGLCCVCVPPR